jgi:hypothetical protein
MPVSKNVHLLRGLISEADALGTRAAKRQFPVLLRPLVENRRVTSIEFRPLLVDAMLTAHPKGFRIFLNSDGQSPAELQERYRKESNNAMMPPRLRFSVAHELAHTLFYDFSEAKPKIAKQFTSGGGRTALENLERSCNRLASHLLLPTPILRDEFLRLKAVNPRSISELADRAGVSLEALLRRLNENDSLFIQRYFKGSIILVDQGGDGAVVRAVAKPEDLNIAHQLHKMRSGDPWKLTAYDGSEILPDPLPEHSHAVLNVETRMSTTQRNYAIAKTTLWRTGHRASYLITFQEGET